MNSNNDIKQNQTEHLTVRIRYTSRNIAIAKVLIVAILSILFARYFVTQAQKEYQRGQEITQEEYLENFTQYRADLLSSRSYANNYPFAVFIFFIVLGSIFGAYELISLSIGFAIGKLIPQNSGHERKDEI